jgi:hypothetical protein
MTRSAGHPRDLFPSGLPIKTVYAFFISPMLTTLPTHITPQACQSLQKQFHWQIFHKKPKFKSNGIFI